MKTMMSAAMVMAAILAGPGPAAAQVKRPTQDLGPEQQTSADSKRLRDDVRGEAGALQAGAVAAPTRKAVRPEKTFGPDLAAFVAAPVGVIVTPINEGLHAFDAAMAPLNEALRPITGPLAPVSAPIPVPVGPAK